MSTVSYWRGIIRRTTGGNAIYIHALRSTADYYGWVDVFDARRPEVAIRGLPPGIAAVGGRRSSGRVGGHRLVISRSPVRQGKEKGMVNEFRVAREATNRDIAEIAALTRVEWCWLTDKAGHRLDRDVWLQRAI
jgi:hypothetical protein